MATADRGAAKARLGSIGICSGAVRYAPEGAGREAATELEICEGQRLIGGAVHGSRLRPFPTVVKSHGGASGET